MEDYSKKYRKINKFILELRYKPKLSMIDKKGEIIESLHEEIKDRYPHWRFTQSDIIFCDDLEKPMDEFQIGMKRTSIIQEGISTFEDFKNNVNKLLTKAYEVLSLDKIERIGCRIIGTYQLENISSFDQARRKIEDTFLKDPINLGLNHKDLFIRIVHDNGFYVIGPVKKEENWLKNNFKTFEDSSLKYGYGFDIDSYGNNFEIKNARAIVAKAEDTLILSKSIEDAIVKSLEQ